MTTSTEPHPAGRQLPHPDVGDVDLGAVLFALSDPVRLDLVRRMAADGPQTVANCQRLTPDSPVPKSTLSHHLKALREAGVIRNEPSGRERVVSLRRAELDARFPGLLDAVVGARDASE